MDSETNVADRPLSIGEAALYLHLSKSYLYKKTMRHEIPFYKPSNGKLLFTLADLREYSRRGRQAANYELSDRADELLAKRA